MVRVGVLLNTAFLATLASSPPPIDASPVKGDDPHPSRVTVERGVTVRWHLPGGRHRDRDVTIGSGSRVLDAVRNVPGLRIDPDKKMVWLERRSRRQPRLVLPVDWYSLCKSMSNETNYPLEAGDVIHVDDQLLQGGGGGRLAKISPATEKM
jgi:hypothetical protein